mgnify:CR=1 FL=1
MTKKLKLEAIIQADESTLIDDTMLKRAVQVLGEVESCKVSENIDKASVEESEKKSDEKKSVTLGFFRKKNHF